TLSSAAALNAMPAAKMAKNKCFIRVLISVIANKITKFALILKIFPHIILSVKICCTCFVQFYMPLIYNRSTAWSGALLFVILKLIF
ncbi:MAG: hypothetical protein PUJ37_01400, partial [Bacteroidales bacterium]|nr:hypothetical protein [Bacteroidales bacterium]